MSEPATTGTGRKIMKTAGIVLVSLACFILVAVVALYFLAEPLAERYIRKQVTKQTNGLYQLDFEKLELHPLTTSITLQELHLKPDTAEFRRQQKAGQAGSSLFEVQSPLLQIEGINLKDILFNNKLTIGSVTIDRPVITQLVDSDMPEVAGEKKKQDSSLASSLQALHIREVNIQDARYRYLVRGEPHRVQHDLPQLTLKVEGLQLDSLGQQDLLQRLKLDEVQVDARNYTYQSPDSVYAIRVGQFSYATREQELKATAVEVQSDYEANAALRPQEARRTMYQLRAPLLHITGLHVAEAWRTKQLQLDRVLLENTDLQVLEDLSVPDTTATPGLAELYASLSPYLREIGVEELRIAGSSFVYRQKAGEVHTVHHLPKADITLQALQLDSATLFTPEQKAFAEALLVTTEGYTYSPLHSPYTFKTRRVELSTRDKTLHATAVHLAGDWEKNDSLKSLNKAKRNFYSIAVPHLRLHDLDLLQAIRTSRLVIGRVAIDNAVIGLRTDQQVTRKTNKMDMQEAYRQVSGLVSELSIGEIRITDASFTHHAKRKSLRRLQQLENASLLATGLKVDSAFIFHPEEKLPLQDLVLSAQNYTYQLPDNTYTFALASLRYSTRSQLLTARSIDVISSLRANERQKQFDNANRNLFDVSATKFRVTGLDLIKALNTGRLVADEVLLMHPDVAILLDRKVAASSSGQGPQEVMEGFSDVLQEVSVNTIRLEDGTFTFSEKISNIMRTHLLEHASATVVGLELTPAIIANLEDKLPMDDMILVATDYTYRTTDSIYTIRLDSLHYSSRKQELLARTFTVDADRDVNERLKAESLHRASRNLVNIAARKFRVSGLDLIHAYATGRFHMNEMVLAAPEVAILQDHNVPVANKKNALTDTTTKSNATKWVSDVMDTFRVQRLRINDGTVIFDILEDTIRRSQTIDHIALVIEQFRLVSLEATDPINMFDAEDFDLLMQGYSFFTRDSLYVLEVKEVKVTLQNRFLTVDSLRLRPLYSKAEYAKKLKYAKDRVDLVVPGIEVQGVSLRALFYNQDIIAEKILIRELDVELYRDNSIGFNPERRPPTLQKALREAGLYIRIDTVVVENSRLIHPVIALNGLEPGIFLLEELYLTIYNVTNDTALIRQNNIVTVDASAKLMGASTLQARFLFRMDHPDDYYTYEGTLEPMDFAAFNPLFEKMMFVRIKSGQILKASFSIESTNHLATGMVHFPYRKLKIELLDKQDPENPGFLLKAGTKLVNLLIVKPRNPSVWGNFREGDVHEERDHQRAIFHHMGQALLNGITSSIMTNLVERIVTTFVDI